MSTTHRHKQRIDDEWHVLNPSWGENKHKGEHAMLYDVVSLGESLLCVMAVQIGRQASQARRMKRSNGIVVATDERLLLLSKGVFGSGEATEVPYSNVSEFSESADNPVLHEVKIAENGGQNYELKTRKNDPTIPLLLRCITAKVSQKSQGGQNHRARIDTQWKSFIAPPFDRTPGEREMLYDLIEQDEDLLGFSPVPLARTSDRRIRIRRSIAGS